MRGIRGDSLQSGQASNWGGPHKWYSGRLKHQTTAQNTQTLCCATTDQYPSLESGFDTEWTAKACRKDVGCERWAVAIAAVAGNVARLA